MEKIEIYLNQSKFRLEMDTGITLESVSKVEIKFRDSDGVDGIWPATQNGNNIYKDFTELEGGGSEFNKLGEWRAWPYITYSDGRKVPGEAVRIIVKKEGG